MGLVRNILNRFRRATAARAISVREDGLVFTWSDGREPIDMRWRAVEEIRTFKVDMAVHDDVRLAFLFDGHWYEISEDESAFPRVVAAMHEHLTGVPADWFEQVVQPPFATNERVLWRAEQ